MHTRRLRGRAILLLVVFTTAGLLVARELAGQNRHTVQAPYFEVDPLLAEAAAQSLGARLDDRRVGGRARSRLDHSSRLGDAGQEGEGARDEAAYRRVLRRRAAGARVRSRRAIWLSHWGGPGARLRVADVEPRHHHRPQRQRLDRRQRPGRLAGPQVQRERQVPAAGRARPTPAWASDAGRQADLRRRQQRPDVVRPRREDLRRPVGQRGVSRRRLLEQARRDRRRRHRQAETVLGRLRQQARRHRPRSVQARRAAGAAVPQPRPLRRSLEGRPGLRVRSREQPDPGVHEGRQVRQGSVLSRRTASARARCGTSPSRRIRRRPISILADGNGT